MDWPPLPMPRAGERHYTPLTSTHDLEVWLIAWGSGSRIEWHDHDGRRGALFVVRGVLLEQTAVRYGARWRLEGSRGLLAGDLRIVDPRQVHRIANEQTTVALTLHAYDGSTRDMLFHDVAVEGPRHSCAAQACH